MVTVLTVIAILVGAIGVAGSSQATFGVALVGFACLLGVIARIVQAAAGQRAQTRAHNEQMIAAKQSS